MRGRGTRTAANDCGRERTIGTPSLTARGISRSEGMKTSGSLPEDGDDVVLADADARVGSVQDELDLLGS